MLALKYQALFHPAFSTILEHLLKNLYRVSQLLKEGFAVDADSLKFPQQGRHSDDGNFVNDTQVFIKKELG